MSDRSGYVHPVKKQQLSADSQRLEPTKSDAVVDMGEVRITCLTVRCCAAVALESHCALKSRSGR